jgi:hypothetical protein
MALIDSEESARRLAQAVIADIRLYNADEIAAGVSVDDAIAEGRALYQKRVAPALHPLFEAALAESPLGAGALGRGLAPGPVVPAPEPLLDWRPFLVAALFAALGVGVYLSCR